MSVRRKDVEKGVALPADWLEEMRRLLGGEYEQFVSALAMSSAVAIRPNKRKGAEVCAATRRVEWYEGGYRLEEPAAFGFDPLWHAGAYYVQEPSSQSVSKALEHAIKRIEVEDGCVGSDVGLRVLDLCAAPGGKATLIGDLLPAGSVLVANEVDARRSSILSENLLKWGLPFVVQTRNMAKDFGERLPGYFDIVCVDAPCSGEGMFRKSMQARKQWSERLVDRCSKLQRSIVGDVWAALRPGGYMIYSTCTYNTLENERNVLSFVEELHAEVIEIEELEGLRERGVGIVGSVFEDCSLPVYRFFPHRVGGEGLFMALLRKPGQGKGEQLRNGVHLDRSFLAEWPRGMELWLREKEEWRIMTVNRMQCAVPKGLTAEVQKVCRATNVLWAAIPMGKAVEKSEGSRRMWPSAALVLSPYLNVEAFPSYDATYGECLRYIHGESLNLPAEVARGFIIVKYSGIPLGGVVNVGGRANNLYPTQWRLRSTHYPQNPPALISVVKE